MREKLLSYIKTTAVRYNWKFEGDTFETSKEYKVLEYLPDEVLQQIKSNLSFYLISGGDFGEILDDTIKRIEYVPIRCTNKEGVPFIGISYRRYLILNDEGIFCVLHEPDEDVSSAWATGKKIPKELFGVELPLCDERDRQFLTWAYLFDCCGGMSTFWRLFSKYSEDLCAFLEASVYNTFNIRLNFRKNDFMHRICNWYIPLGDYLEVKSFQLVKDAKLLGQLRISSNKYQLEVVKSDGNHVVYSVDLNKDNFVYILDAICSLSYTELKRLCIVLLFGVSGISLNSKGWYTLDKLQEYESQQIKLLNSIEQIL